MSTSPTTAIVGAGSSGIAVAKALHERGLPFASFESSDRVGGLLQPLGAITPLAEGQARWLAECLLGRHQLPPRHAMEADIRRESAQLRKRYVASERHTIQVDLDRYLVELRRELRRGAERARAAGFTQPLPARPAQRSVAA
jgi:dimethylaniline monooxygenase (N-oxide forming)